MADYGYGLWSLVLTNIILFGLFILFVPFRKNNGRLPASVYLAFIVALYTEMYGFPLTIYILAWLFGYENPLTHTAGHVFAGFIGEDLFYLIVHPLSELMIFIGFLLIIFGWQKIYQAEGQLVTTGVYAHVRHPQYLGFILLTFGMLIQWVTIPILLMWPILAILYYRLARKEEEDMEATFGSKYQEYKRKVPMFIPFSKSLRLTR